MFEDYKRFEVDRGEIMHWKFCVTCDWNKNIRLTFIVIIVTRFRVLPYLVDHKWPNPIPASSYVWGYPLRLGWWWITLYEGTSFGSRLLLLNVECCDIMSEISPPPQNGTTIYSWYYHETLIYLINIVIMQIPLNNNACLSNVCSLSCFC